MTSERIGGRLTGHAAENQIRSLRFSGHPSSAALAQTMQVRTLGTTLSRNADCPHLLPYKVFHPVEILACIRAYTLT